MARRQPQSLRDLVSVYMDRAAVVGGAAYHQQGRVEIIASGPDLVESVVLGSAAYSVMLDCMEGDLVVSCTCPRYASGEFCKHIWATVLASDERGCLRSGLAGADAIVFRDDEWVAEEETEEEVDPPPVADGKLIPLARGWQPAQPERPARLRVLPLPPPWSLLLGAVAAAADAPVGYGLPARIWPAGQQLAYLLDASRATGVGGRPLLHVLSHRPKKAGGWTRPQPYKSHGLDPVGEVQEPLDRQIITMLSGGSPSYGYPTYHEGKYGLSRELLALLLPLLCQTGRLHVRAQPEPEDALGVTYAFDEGAPWEFRLRVLPGREGGDYVVSGLLVRGDATMDLSEPVLLLAGGWVFARGRAAPLHDPGVFPWITALLTGGVCPALELPEELRVTERAESPLLRLALAKHGGPWNPDRLSAALSFVYDGVTVPAEPWTHGVYDSDRRVLLRRHAEAEQGARRLLGELGFQHDHYALRPNAALMLPTKQLRKVLPVLLAANWLVETDGKLCRRDGVFRVQVRSGIDWFELHGELDFGEVQVSVPALLAAARKGENTIVLNDGSLGVLPETWLKEWGLLAAARVEGNHLRFGRGQTALLDALLAARPEASCDETFRRARAELQRFESVEPVDPPCTFSGELRAYQREGLGWLHFLRQFGMGGCLADDMGLGKTVQVLALLETRRQLRAGEADGKGPVPGPSLVVVPRSLLFNWRQEAGRFTPQMRVHEHRGLGRQRGTVDFGSYDLVLTTYGTLRREVGFLQDTPFDYVVLDEAQAIKNADTASAKAARLLRGQHRLALSGTPIENHLGELWSLIEFLNPGMLGPGAAFQKQVRRVGDLDDVSGLLLSRALRPVILRRTKTQVARDLPERTEQTIHCELEGEQRRYYDELRDYYRRSVLSQVAKAGLARSKIQVLEALLRLRQAACHPGLIDKSLTAGPSAKLEALIPQLTEVIEEGHKALVFSQFTSLLAIVRERLDAAGIAYAYLDGMTRDREQRVERFQTDPQCPLFLISLKAGGLGLNLTAAEYVFLLDPWWNPAVEAQAIDRTHRIGQTRRVFAYRLIARDTVEEKVVQLQQTKRDLADAIIGADNSLIRTLTREDLEALLG